MKMAVITWFSLAVLISAGHAQTKATQKVEPKPDEIRRLESVTWDLKTHTLKWTVQKGTEVKGEFVPSSADHYEITPDEATMKLAAEKRGFDVDEASVLHRLLDTLSLYCAQSTVWWDHGEGERVTDDADRSVDDAVPATPAKPKNKAPDKPDVKPTQDKPSKALPLGVAEVSAHPLRGQ